MDRYEIVKVEPGYYEVVDHDAHVVVHTAYTAENCANWIDSQ